MIDCCSYCQRQYGTKGILSPRVLQKTFDHIVSNRRLKDSDPRKTFGRRGMCTGRKLTLEQAMNLIDCCSECNFLKSDHNLYIFSTIVTKEFYPEELHLTVIQSIKTLINTKPLPVPLYYLE